MTASFLSGYSSGGFSCMEIIKLPSEIGKKRKLIRSENLKKNKHAYGKLKSILVPNKIKLS